MSRYVDREDDVLEYFDSEAEARRAWKDRHPNPAFRSFGAEGTPRPSVKYPGKWYIRWPK